MQSYRLRLSAQKTWWWQRYFNLMQSYRLRQYRRRSFGVRPWISILCSHTDCDSNNAQRLHFVYNIALCALPFLMLYLWYFANISLVITSILLCLLVRSSQQFYACLLFALFFHLYQLSHNCLLQSILYGVYLHFIHNTKLYTFAWTASTKHKEVLFFIGKMLHVRANWVNLRL